MEQDSEDLKKLDISVQMGLLQGTFTTELYEQHSEPSIVLCDLSIISKIEINKWSLAYHITMYTHLVARNINK